MLSIALQIVFGLILVGGAAMMFWLPFAIAKNLKKSGDYRLDLARRVELVRHGGMLKALDINVTEYLYQTRITDVHRQLKACNDCDRQVACVEDLASGKVNLDQVQYCKNHGDLREIKAAQEARAEKVA